MIFTLSMFWAQTGDGDRAKISWTLLIAGCVMRPVLHIFSLNISVDKFNDWYIVANINGY